MRTHYTSSMGVGNIQAAETDVLFTPSRALTTADIGIILLHGATTPNEFADHTRWGSVRLAARLALAGYPCIAGAMANDAFANDTVMARITAARAFLASATGCSPNKTHLLGVSMGGGTAVRYAALNPTKVESITGIIPMANIDALYQANTLGLRASIGTAWGVTYPTALPAGANLLAQAPAIATADIPVRFYYDDADAAIDPADVLALAVACDATTFEIPPDLGHVEGTIDACADIGGTNWSGLIGWLDSL